MPKLDSNIMKLALDCGGKDHMPFNAYISLGYPQIEKFHKEVSENVYHDVRDYIRWALMDAIDDEKIVADIMFDVMKRYEQKYERFLNDK